jgi:transcriptional regulator with XRE-family HTH domain
VLTQEELAQLVGVSASTISPWEAGKKQPRSKHIHRLAVALGLIEQDILSALQKRWRWVVSCVIIRLAAVAGRGCPYTG